MWMSNAAISALKGIGSLCAGKASAKSKAYQVYRCNHCAQNVSYTAEHAGAAGNCPRCWKRIRLPQWPLATANVA